ncbi:12836_t:CDS:2 [Funneliformis mosseae]|uniref:12836_t:CDS:1 n=1 Tax=Funneliformis mosseae TaxID=27381 RepID=A0A9N9DGK1_FUNMO|nr:12836_t:CDS:2 [Funneliformis mosseae]
MENHYQSLSKRENIRIRVQIISIARRVRIARFHRVVASQNLRVNVLKERPRNDNYLSTCYSTGVILVYRNEHPGYIEPREVVRIQINFNSEKGLNGSTGMLLG